MASAAECHYRFASAGGALGRQIPPGVLGEVLSYSSKTDVNLAVSMQV
jgi:hypothetical protein